jgi:NAD(P)-dependent dehydrogenase (short-subunit alcohol dehydrogenase family)
VRPTTSCWRQRRGLAALSPLTGKLALVTGAGRGLGAAIARRLSQLGAHVVAGVRTAPFPLPVVADTPARIPLDVLDERSVLRAFEWIDSLHRGLDVLVNNAGVAVFKPLPELTVSDFEVTLSTNVTGAFLCAREAFPRMAANGGGRLIHLGSIAAVEPLGGTGAYAASKAALEALSRSFNKEGAERAIRSTLLRLGACATDLMAGVPGLDVADMLSEDEVADTIAYIAGLPLSMRIDALTLLPPKGLL